MNAVTDLLILPTSVPSRASFAALCGRHVVVGAHMIAVGATGQIVYDDGEGFVEREIVSTADIVAIDRDFDALL